MVFKMFLFRSLIFLMILLTKIELQGANIHLILVGDLLANDLKTSILVDLNNMRKHATEISKNIGFQVVIHPLEGVSATPQNVMNTIQELETDINDIIILYFSGHGYRTRSKEINPWPNFYFTSTQEGIDMLDVADHLKLKNAHFVLMIADCCNNIIPELIAPRLHRKQFNQLSDFDSRRQMNYKKLFVEFSGFIMIASSEAGQTASGNDFIGGIYTQNYLETIQSLITNTSNDLLNWQMTLDQISFHTIQYAEKNYREQNPIYVISPR